MSVFSIRIYTLHHVQVYTEYITQKTCLFMVLAPLPKQSYTHTGTPKMLSMQRQRPNGITKSTLYMIHKIRCFCRSPCSFVENILPSHTNVFCVWGLMLFVVLRIQYYDRVRANNAYSRMYRTQMFTFIRIWMCVVRCVSHTIMQIYKCIHKPKRIQIQARTRPRAHRHTHTHMHDRTYARSKLSCIFIAFSSYRHFTLEQWYERARNKTIRPIYFIPLPLLLQLVAKVSRVVFLICVVLSTALSASCS